MTEMSLPQKLFAERMEELLKALLTDASVQPFRFFLNPDESGGCRGKIDLLSPSDLQSFDELLRREFDVDEGLSQSVVDVEEKGELALADYVFSLKAPRSILREWLPFAERRCRLQVGTVLQSACDVLNASLGFSEEGEVSSRAIRKLARVNALLEEAEEGYRILLGQSKVLRTSPEGETFPSAPGGAGRALPQGKKTAEFAPTTEASDEGQRSLSASDRPDLASLRLFFGTHSSWLETWEALAAQKGITLSHPPLAQQEVSLRDLARLLEAAEIEDFRSLEEQFVALDESALKDRLESLYGTFGDAMNDWKIAPYDLILLVFLDVHWDKLKDQDLEANGIKAAMDRIRSKK